MRYILLIYQNTEAWNGLSQDDRDIFMRAAGDIVEELSATGEFVGGEGLADASQARSTHVRDGVVTVTDGPFLEAKESAGRVLHRRRRDRGARRGDRGALAGRPALGHGNPCAHDRWTEEG